MAKAQANAGFRDPYDGFRERCDALIAKSGERVSVRYERMENGLFIARFSNGVKITGNQQCKSVRVHWGSGHTAVALI